MLDEDSQGRSSCSPELLTVTNNHNNNDDNNERVAKHQSVLWSCSPCVHLSSALPFLFIRNSGLRLQHRLLQSCTLIPEVRSAKAKQRNGEHIQSMSQPPLAQAFKPGTLYAVMLYRDDGNSWHCALFLPSEPLPSDTPETLRGTAWRCTNKNDADRWTYDEVQIPSSDLESASEPDTDALRLHERLVLGAALADLAPLGAHNDVAAELSLVLRGVLVRPDAHRSVFNCRTWMLDGIGELDDGGFLSCASTMALERELVSAAVLATPKYEEDGSYVMITPRNCSDN